MFGNPNSHCDFITMVALRLIPCLDVSKGRVVKGVNFVQLRDAGDPVELAYRYSIEGADELVFLDISASHEQRGTLLEIVERTAKSVTIPFTVGGGIKSVNEITEVLRAGADKISLNSSAVQNPSLINEAAVKFGSQCIVIAVDAKKNLKEPNKWEVFINGGRRNTGIDVLDWVNEVSLRGAGEILLTSMDGDGTRNGYDLELTKRVSDSVSIPVIASGGAGTLEHICEAFVQGSASAALLASLLHDGDLTIKQIKDYLISKGLSIRP